MNKLIENAMTIEEKCENYSIGQKVDYSYFEEWRDVRTLLSDRYFDVMLKEMKLSKDAFAFSLRKRSIGGTLVDLPIFLDN